jgi:hypothetical protein
MLSRRPQRGRDRRHAPGGSPIVSTWVTWIGSK